MKLKYFIIALVAMLSGFGFNAFAQDVIYVHNVEELKQVLTTMSPAQSRSVSPQRAAARPMFGVALADNFNQEETEKGIQMFLNNGMDFYLNLNGQSLNINLTISNGEVLIVDDSSAKTGAFIGSITTQTGTSLVVESGNIISNGGAAIVNGGVLTIDGGAVIGKITDNGGTITKNENADYNMALLADVATMQKALNVAIDGQGVKFAQDIEGNLTVPQSPGTKITVDGDNNTMKGYIVVDGKSYAYPTTGTTIKNVRFDASAISLGASVNLGDGGNTTRYTNNVTVDNCTFKGDIAKAAVKSYQGGCKNLVVSNCKAEGMHSLLQAVNIQGITITGCTANTKNGINLNSSSNVTVENNTINVQGYAVRVGVKGGESGKIELQGNTLTSQCADGDAVVVLRGTAPTKVDLTMEKNAVSGTTHISGHAANTKMELDANYWDGKEQPVIADGAQIKVNSYYKDKACTDLERNEMGGSIIGYTSTEGIYGETWGNAISSYVIKVVDAQGNVMGTSSLNNVNGIINGNVTVTWNIKFDAASNTDEYWTMSWTKAPTIANMPAKVQLWVDGEKVSEGDVKLNGPDDLWPIAVAVTDENGVIKSCAQTLEAAVAAGNNVAILKAGTYALKVKDGLTITGAVEGVEFANIGAFGCNGANVTFNNVTFTYAENSTYKGLQHSGNLVYNNCTFNGQVFLYGQSETFNNCTFNTTDSNNYNVWTYGAKNVAFNGCTFNSAGKSVLIYAESTDVTNNVTVTESTFKASQTVEGKAAIEMDSNLSGAINLTIDGKTKAEGFAAGSVSGNSLWNNKNGNKNNNANNDITVTVDGETVLKPIYEAKIGETGHRKFQEAINAVKNGETITLVSDIVEDVTLTEKVGLYYTIDGDGKTMTGTITVSSLSDTNDNRRITIKNINFVDTVNGRDFITSTASNHYPRITVEGCSFTGTGKEAANSVAVRLKSSHSVVIKDCTGTDLHSFLQNTSGWNLTIENVKVTDSKSGFALGTVQGVTVKGANIDVAGYGIRMDAQYNNNAVIESNKVEAFIPVVVRKAEVNSNITVQGTNEMTATNTDGIWCAIGKSEYETNGTMPTPATAQVKVALNDTGLKIEGVYGNFGVASIGTVNYNTLAEALAAAKNNETVTLNWSEGDAAIAMNGAVFGKDVTIKGTAKVDWSKGFLFVGRGGEGNATVTFDGANLTSASNSASTGIHVSGREKNTTNKYDGTLVIKNSTIELDYLINRNAIELDNATLKVKNGFGIAGRPASETESGANATATISLANNSKVVVNNHNGMGLGQAASVLEGLGVMNIDATSTFETTQGFVVTANGTMNIAGKATVAGTLTNQGAINMIDKAATLTSSECGNVTTNVADHKVVYANGTYKVVAKKYVAIIDENRKFETFKEALDAILGGETITLVADDYTEGKESGEIDFDRAIAFTITGKSTKYALPVVTFQNAKVTIKDAEILIPELDARQDAVINIVNSTVHDAGGNSIAKSYYNGTINIDANSTVHMMQVTTMGYINVAGTLNATWQTNVYGNGIITLAEGAKFNTAALHLTGQDYSGRDNTAADRVGKPATIVVDGATLNVGKVIANNGSDYSYNSSKGINIGTVDGKQALLDIKNGGAVNFHMANGQTTNFGAGATVNVASSTLKTICRDENGTVTLANNGAVYVTGNSQLDVKKYSGNTIKIENANLADSYFAGAVNAFGTNNISGTTEIGGVLSVGYSGSPTEQVVVNITGNFKGTNVLVGSSNESVLNLGVAESSRTTAHFGQLGAFGDVNVANADVTYGYAFIRNDFNAINSTFAIKGGVNTYFAGNAKVVLDNTTWSLPGYANIGSYGGYMYGNADVTLKNGSSMTATNLGIEVSGEKVVKLTLEDNSTFTATALKNQGSIVLADAAATLKSNEVQNVTTNVADHKVVYADGIYKAVAKIYVATIDENRKYESFEEALANVVNGDIITLVADCGENVTIQQKVGVSFTVDGADKTYTGTITVKGDGVINGNNTETLTFKNINFVAKAGAYAITAVKGSHARNITVDGCTFKGTETSYGIRVRNGWNYTVKNTTVDGLRSFFNASENLSGLTVENVTVKNANSAFNAAYGFGKATFKNVNIKVADNGIWIENHNAFNMTLENCSIAAAKPIQVEEYAKFTNSITLNGTNNLVAANDGNWLTIVDAPAVDATFTVLANDPGLDLSKVEGLAAYAKNAQRSYGSNKFQNVTSATLDGDVVTLLADVAMDTKNYTTQVDGHAVLFNVKGKAVTFDLNGKKIAVNASAADLGGKMLLGVFSADIEGDFTITDNSAESTGIVEVNVNDANVYSVFVSENAGDKTKSGKMTVNAGNFTTIGKVSNAMIFADTDKVITINGGKFICDGATTTSTNPWIVNTLGNNERQVVINGGTFNADINHQHRPFEVYVPKNLAVKSNGDATWTIVSAQAYVTEMLGATVDESGNYSHEVGYATLKEAFTAVEEGETVTVLPGVVTENVKLPAELANVTITAEEGAVLKDMTISAADGNSYNYVGLTFDGLTFDNSRIVMTGWRNGEETIEDLTVTNCTFKNLDDNTNTAPVHINKDAAEAVNGFTFTNNVIDGATGDKKSGVYAQLTGKVVFTDNVINNVAFRPYVIQLTTNDGIDDELIVTGNTFSGSAVGRAQGLGSDAAGTDAVNLVVSNNIFKGITDAQQICYWSFNPETTTADLSKNYYDIDIVKNPGKIYYNAAATGVEDLLAMNVYPFYTALNEDGTINTASLKEAPVAKVIYPVGNSEYADGAVVYYDTMLEAVPNTSNCPRLEGATIQLIRDASAKGLRLMENGMVLDLNGKTYTITEATGSKGTETSGFQIRPEVTTGATIQNGTINVAEGTNVVWLFNSYATDFVLNNVVVDCANLNWNYGEQCKVLVNRKGDNVQLTGNTEFQNFDSNVAPNAMSIEGTMTIGDDVKLGNMTIEMATTTTINGPQGLNVVADNSDYAVIWNNGVYSTTYSDYISEFTINDGEYTEFEFDCLNGVANVGTLTYKRKIYDKDLYDLFVPFEIPVSELMQLGFQVFYINDFRSYDSSGREQLVLESVLIEDGILRANHPYLFRFVGDNIPTEGLVLTLENAVLYSTNSENHTVVDCSSAYKRFEIKGTYNIMSSDELNGSLILGAGNKWGPISDGYSLKPFRLTLTISNRDGSPVKIEEPVAVRLFGVDAETAIDDVEMTYSDENTIFDLQGRRVQKPVKGNLYIINGKKVVY